MTSQPATPQSAPASHPPDSLGLATLISLVIANMIGIGVFTSSGFSLATLGDPGQVILAWLICGFWAIAGAISYGGLAARLPISGGEYLFLSRLVHPSIGFLAGWISLFAGFTAPIALAAKGAAIHILTHRSSDELIVTLLAAALILLAAGCHLAGVRLGAHTQNAIVAAKLLLLLVVIAVALFSYNRGDWQGGLQPENSATEISRHWLPSSLPQWWILVGSMSWIALSYTGFNAAVYVAGESRDAVKSVPRAMILGTLLVTLLYLMLNVVFVYAPPPAALVDAQGQGREAVAMIASEFIGGKVLSGVLRIVIVLAMTSSVFAMLMLGPRVYRQMSHDGVLPEWVGHSSLRPAILAQTALSVLAVFLGDILQLMTYLGLTLSACSSLAVGSLWWVQWRHPQSRPLRVYERISIAVYLAISVAIIAAAAQQRSEQFKAMLGTFAAGLIVFFLWQLSGWSNSYRKASD